MSELKLTFSNAVIPDGKTAEMLAAADFEGLAKEVDGVNPMSW